jgi:hypothetical protein
MRCLFVCSKCVALQSPYCAWHKRESKCVTIPLDKPILRRDYIQNVSTGNHSDCPKVHTDGIRSNPIILERNKSTSSRSGDASGSQTITTRSEEQRPNKDVSSVYVNSVPSSSRFIE